MEIAAVTAVLPLAVGALDAAEYALFNPKVHEIHNFPDIVPDWPHGSFAAFASGVLCSWWIFLPLAVIFFLIAFWKSPERQEKISTTATIVFAATFLGLFGMMCGDLVRGSPWATEDPFGYHKAFYAVIAIATIAVLITTVWM